MTRADNIGSEHPFPWHVYDPTPGRFYAACEVHDANGVTVASHMRPGIAETVAQAVNQWAEQWFRDEELRAEGGSTRRGQEDHGGS